MSSEQSGARRLAAVLALASGAVLAVLGIDIVLSELGRGLIVLASLAIACAAAWHGLTHTGGTRLLGLGIAILAGVVALAVLIDGDHLGQALAIVVALALLLLGIRLAFRVQARHDQAPDPGHPVLFYNPKSGGGKAEKFRLADEARARGIEPIELQLGTDLEQLVRGAVADGADALAMAGGDGSQAVVAMVAAEKDLPYACIPAGTRNHFALDLGVDREDVIGALDAFVGGRERRVDLAEVNGRVFVNNVSIGLYAEAVQREGYREAKLRTILDTLPEVLGPEGKGPELRWTGPEGQESSSGAAILVSNNRYRLGRAVGSGTRPSIDDGLLGIAVASAPAEAQDLAKRPWREWSVPAFEVEVDGSVAAGIDGEAVTLEAPLRFRILPAVLRVRIAAAHPGASPSAALPEGPWDTVRALVRIAITGAAQPAGASSR
ncbi:MAG TPA: diacylglycerol kinase family protein [Solirubrobacterales bacterium]|nr:diacylglycerol kinase family protein [Solirubrobacterales bacterium]